jgi:FkbM family methyltransferase
MTTILKLLLLPFTKADATLHQALHLLRHVRRLRKQHGTVHFVAEGNTAVSLPPVSYAGLVFRSHRRLVEQCANYASRPSAESLLRRTVYALFETGCIDPRRSIIDIGCWIGDNAVVWAKMLRGDAAVYAVDPSPGNLDFGRSVAALNAVRNIKWIQAVCADQPNLNLRLSGDLDHAQFNDHAQARSQTFVTTTLDEVVPRSSHGDISLLHVDVEGFEERVLGGATSIIAASKPVIVFEQHISKEDPRRIADKLKGCGYRVFMINEVLPGCDLDCRNFIAFHRDGLPPSPGLPQHSNGRADGIWYAALGPAMLELE